MFQTWGTDENHCCTTKWCTHWAVSKGLRVIHGTVVKAMEYSHPLYTKKALKVGLWLAYGDRSLVCKYPGCNGSAKYVGLCRKHCDNSLLKWCNYDGCENFILKVGCCWSHCDKSLIKQCNCDGCEKIMHKVGRCWSHQIRMKCTHEGCTNNQQNGGLCPLHWAKKIEHACSVEGCKDKAARGRVCKFHIRTIDVGYQNYSLELFQRPGQYLSPSL